MGGKTFKDQKTGFNPASRIPTEDIRTLEGSVLSVFYDHFKKMELVTSPELFNKEDHGDIDFLVLPLENSRETLRIICNNLGYLNKPNGNMEHILVPLTNKDGGLSNYQVDFIFCKDCSALALKA